MEISNKKISIIGAVRSGTAAAKLVKKAKGIPFVSDLNKDEKVFRSVEILKQNDIEFEVGNHSERIFDCDLMIISPGIPSNADVILKAKERNIKIISEIELAYNFCKGKIVAITGTNGKTTTTSLCGYVFKTCGAPVYVAGNIGYAFSEIAFDVKRDEYVVLEVSSFQLDFIDKFKPNVAVILNITPDHLNRYENEFENYINSKLRIYENQNPEDYLVINKDDKTLINSLTKRRSRNFYFSISEPQINGAYLSDDAMIYNFDGALSFSCSLKEINLKGEHNYLNAMAVVTASKIFGFDNEKIREGLRTFKGVEHRLELVREIGGVKFINDSKATNVDSVWYALKSFEQPIFLILGGQDKGNDYGKIKQLVSDKVKKIFAIGSSCDTIFNFFHNLVKVQVTGTLEEAVTQAASEASENEIVLLSPACASFDMFDNFEHRGKVFKETVNKL